MTLNKFINEYGVLGKTDGHDTSFLTNGETFIVENIIPNGLVDRFTVIHTVVSAGEMTFTGISDELGKLKFIGTKKVIFDGNLTNCIMVGPMWHLVQMAWYGVSFHKEQGDE